jgi:Na+-transporting NADH:ubiquinone oxidoreductase subunit NqrB
MTAATAPEPRPSGIYAGLDPRYLIAGLITLVLVVGQARYAILGGYERLLVALTACVVTELMLSWFVRGRVANLQSAYISGISMSLLTKPQGGFLWPFAIGGFLAIASKYVLTYRNRHLWNPTNFAISVLLLVAPNRVSILSHQWGNEVVTNAIIWIFGLVIVTRVRALHVSLAYVSGFLALAGARSLLLHQPLLPEIAPLTGPMYQLFVFFMVTDPRTTVASRRGRIVVALLVAVCEAGIRTAADFHVPMPTAFSAAPAILALAIVGPIAKWLDLRRAAPERPAAVPAGPPLPA